MEKGLKEVSSDRINLYSNDTSLYTKWNIESLPSYTLLDAEGKVLGKDISQPDEASIDWILYSATRGVHPVEAIWREHAQNKLMEQHRSASAFTDQEFAKWFASMLPAFLEFNRWRQQHAKSR